MPVVRDLVGHDHCRQRPRLAQRELQLALLCGLLRNVPRYRIALRHAAQVLLDQRQRLLGFEVADQRERRVVRHVVRVVEFAHRGNRRGLQVLHAPDRLVLVGMRRKCLVENDFREAAERLILEAHPALFLHDFALVLELVFVHVERCHAIGFQPETSGKYCAGTVCQ
jgi:hypothetical protein